MQLRLDITALDGRAGPDLGAGGPLEDPIDALLARGPAGPVALLDGQLPSGSSSSLLALELRDLPGGPPRDLAGLRDALGSSRLNGEPAPGPFSGGFLGALAYELGVEGEGLRLPPPAHPVPPVVGGVVTDFVVWKEGRAWLVVGRWLEQDSEEDVAGRRGRWLELFEETVRAAPAPPVAPRPAGPLECHVEAAEHVRRVELLRAAIARGELYQANLSRRFSRALRGEPRELLRRLRAASPAPMSAYLEWSTTEGRSALLSSSPELLLEVREDGRTRTQPIKGTAPRSDDPLEDERLARGLEASAKDRAELAMIVDLERNDLARVARPGSVVVGPFPRRMSFATVHHLLADVEARLADGEDALSALAVLYPGGSITGAPKLASMELLARLEEEGRGFFTGSLGFVDVRGEACFNILIRTITWHARGGAGGDRALAEFHAGGGITWRSDAHAEEEETRIKGAALAAVLCGEGEPRETLGITLRTGEAERAGTLAATGDGVSSEASSSNGSSGERAPGQPRRGARAEVPR